MYQIKPRLVARTWQIGDEPYLALAANNFNIWKFLKNTFPHPYTYDDARDWIDLNLKQSTPLNFALVYDGNAVGCIGIIPGTDVHSKSAEFGYWLAEEYWGKGIMTDSVLWMVDYVFRNFEFNRLWAGVFSNNPASIKVLLNAGFKQEALLHQAVFKNGEFLDEFIFSITR